MYSATPGGGGGLWGFITNFKVSIPVIFLVTTLIGGFGAAVEKNDFTYLIKEVGDRFFSVNHAIYVEADRIVRDQGIIVKVNTEKRGNFLYDKIYTPLKKVFATIGAFWNLIVNILIFIWWFIFLNWLASKIGATSGTHIGTLLIAIVVWFAISTVYASVWIYPPLEAQGVSVPLTVKLNPFSGFFRLADAFQYMKPTISETTIINNTTNTINNNTINVDITI